MVTDDDALIPLTEARRLFPVACSLSTVHRWREHGVRGVRLACVLSGGRWYVRPSEINRFCEALQAGVAVT